LTAGWVVESTFPVGETPPKFWTSFAPVHSSPIPVDCYRVAVGDVEDPGHGQSAVL
jgi:hypothetical protein